MWSFSEARVWSSLFSFLLSFLSLKSGSGLSYKKQGRENYKYQSGIEYEGYKRRSTNLSQLNFPGILPPLPPPPLVSGWSVNLFPYLKWWPAQQHTTWLFHCATFFPGAIVCRDRYHQQNLRLERGVSKWLFVKNNWQKL